MNRHQYIERASGRVCDERLFADRVVRTLYSPIRERMPLLFNALTGARASKSLALFNYDSLLGARLTGQNRFVEDTGVDLTECLDAPASLDTPRKIFERRIRYGECRPMADEPSVVVSPADARVLTGRFVQDDALRIKEKFFGFTELLGAEKEAWLQAFDGGDYAVFRLTPDKYHYNHTPVAGTVVDYYAVEVCYHACDLEAVVAMVTPFSKNRRVVTVIDTDVPGGTGVGLVAMIEVVALMIGDIVQAYSETGYENPRPMRLGMTLHKGVPKSLYRPGSSTDVLLFQKGRVRFAEDILANQQRRDVNSRFTRGFDLPLVETEVRVRETVASRVATVTDSITGGAE